MAALRQPVGIDCTDAGRSARAKRVRLTQAGERKVKAAAALWAKAQGGFENALGKKKAADLRKLLAYLASDDFAELFPEKKL